MYKYKAKLVRVVDGDTADVMIDLGFNVWTKQRLRFKGVDTWEKRTRDKEEKIRGLAATAFTTEYLEKNINKITKKQVFITHELENRYFFPINDKKIVVAKIGKDFSWFSFVTLFITLYGLILYIYGMINIYNVFNDTITFYGILILTAVTFAIGYWWFVNNTGEKRLREVYDY